MNEIKCPHCGQSFTVDEAGYAAIVQQVRSDEFNKEIGERLEAEKKHWAEKQAAEKETEIEKAVSKKEKEIGDLRLELERLNAAIKNSDTEKALAVKNAVSETQSEYAKKLRKAEDEALQLKQKIALDAKDHEREINGLKAALENSETKNQLKLNEAVGEVKQQLDKEKAAHEADNKAKDEQIEYYKDFKAKLSTKMVGESLEQHCEIEFNRLRMTAFPRASFEKDNDAKSGSKGDFIYREKDEDGIELLSIMFEMKNEMDTTATKHKNEDFFKELDKDRTEKKCEYAVLVSLLEADSELYTGITDVSYRYEKMYVIRPQFFIPMITLLRGAALNSLQYKRELELVKAQNIDITNFENNLNVFKGEIKKNYRLAGQHFHAAIENINDTIKKLEKTKKELELFENNLRYADDKSEDITIKKLTRNNPTMAAKFAALPSHEEN